MNYLPKMMLLVLIAALIAPLQQANAHFVWLSINEDGQAVEVHFGEDASGDDPALLKRLEGIEVNQILLNSEVKKLDVQLTEESLSAKLRNPKAGGLVIASYNYGVIQRGDAKFQLKYYAKTGPAADHASWGKVKTQELADFDIIPTVSGNQVSLQVVFKGKPISGSEVIGSGPKFFELESVSDSSGTVNFEIKDSGIYSIRARHIEKSAGKKDGKSYSETRHYATITIKINTMIPVNNNIALPNLPLTLTSFGGAMLGDDIYVYGGHVGGAHSYSTAEQSDQFLRLNAKTNAWEELPVGPKLQGLALISDGSKIYRIGGFTAKNAEGDEHDLWSQATVKQYDPATNKWTDLPSMPEPRSSFDAAILDNTIYVLGGWSMAGEADNVWHKTGWKLDLSAETLEWMSLSEIPFQRRALAVAAYQGKIYVIGGMQADGEPTTQVDVYDPSTKKWSSGPSLVGEKGMVGFGASAIAADGRLYVSTINGTLQQLSEDGKSWKTVSKLANARFFHQMLPWKKSSLVMVGGASMQTGKFEEVDVIDVSKLE
ncbi:MAG: hypothetical protein COA78_02240 [Blastopirellula sp.]|nr:MAG: hypothetical protein COA78_02240 [Blastopirellula sp.]